MKVLKVPVEEGFRRVVGNRLSPIWRHSKQCGVEILCSWKTSSLQLNHDENSLKFLLNGGDTLCSMACGLWVLVSMMI